MTSKGAKDPNKELERQRMELEEALNEQIVHTMRQSALPNTIAWLAVVLGSFLLNLGLLVVITGG